MTEGTTPGDPREEPPREQPPPSYPPAGPPPPPPPGGGWSPPPPPPPSGGWGQTPPGGYPPPQPGTSGLAENVASGLAYVVTWITGLIFFFVDRRPEVRFHAMQAIAYGVVWTVVLVLRPLLPGVLFGLLELALFVGWIVLMIQGFQGNHFKLPVLGDFAEQQAGRPGP